jgi:hypothetical protein
LIDHRNLFTEYSSDVGLTAIKVADTYPSSLLATFEASNIFRTDFYLQQMPFKNSQFLSTIKIITKYELIPEIKNGNRTVFENEALRMIM